MTDDDRVNCTAGIKRLALKPSGQPWCIEKQFASYSIGPANVNRAVAFIIQQGFAGLMHASTAICSGTIEYLALNDRLSRYLQCLLIAHFQSGHHASRKSVATLEP